MNILIENDQVIIELTALEFAAFESMFDNLNNSHSVFIEGREWPEWSIYKGKFTKPVLPMHLCRTISEACAVEQAGPLDLLSLYPFWKYGSVRPTANGFDQTILPRNHDLCGSPQASILSTGFSRRNTSTVEANPRAPRG
ncbi:hypothetical protein KAH81_10015 [bacterium]|nr:hypothetical protein [bacterium]